MLGPIPVGLLASAVPPAFTGYNAYYLIGVTNQPWTPALPQGVTGDPAIWSISPALPTGLTINPSTGAISGTPTATVNAPFTVYATNAGGVASQNVTIQVTADTYAEFFGPGVFNWYLPNGVCNAYIRSVVTSGGGGGTRSGTYGLGDYCTGAGGGSGRNFTNLDYRSPGGDLAALAPGTLFAVTLGAGGAAMNSIGADMVVKGGSHNFPITSGVHAGKTMIVLGGNKNTTALYNPVTDDFSVGPTLPNNAFLGGSSFLIPTGADAGKTLVVLGNGSTNTALYDPALGTFSSGPALSSAADERSHNFYISSGVDAGKFLVVSGAGTNTSSLFDPGTSTFSTGPTLSGIVGTGASAFLITSGADSGKTLVIHGDGSTSSSLYDPAVGTFSPGPTLPAFTGSGSVNFTITSGIYSGQTLVTRANNSLSGTALFDPTTSTFSSGPSLSGNAGDGSSVIPITVGLNAGKTLIVHGGLVNTTSLFDPVAGTFSAGPTLSTTVYFGGSSFLITSGLQSGRYLIIHGDSTPYVTTFFTPASTSLAVGPTMSPKAADGGKSTVVIDGGAVSFPEILGGEGAYAPTGTGGIIPLGGLPGGGNNGQAGYGGVAVPLSPGTAQQGPAGGYGVATLNGITGNYTSFDLAGRGTGGGVYFTSPGFGAWTPVPAVDGYNGGGGGGGGIGVDGGSANIVDTGINHGSNGGDGYAIFDWGQNPATFWATF